MFVVHGMQDLNVRTKNFGQWWDALAANGVERKIWLSQTGHVDPFDYRRAAWVDTLHQWFDHYLLGYDNGIQSAADGRHRAPPRPVDPPTGLARRPAPRPTTVHPVNGPAGRRSALAKRRSGRDGLDLHRQPRSRRDQLGRRTSTSRPPDKAGFTTAPLTKDLRVSGSSRVTVTATPTTSSAHLSAVLVDLGPDTIRNYAGAGEGILTGTDRTCWGASTAGDSSCYLTTSADKADVGYTVFSRGWADLGHYASDRKGVPLTPGKPYTITLDLAATDHVVPAGHRLALIVAGTDNGLIDPPAEQADPHPRPGALGCQGAVRRRRRRVCAGHVRRAPERRGGRPGRYAVLARDPGSPDGGAAPAGRRRSLTTLRRRALCDLRQGQERSRSR